MLLPHKQAIVLIAFCSFCVKSSVSRECDSTSSPGCSSNNTSNLRQLLTQHRQVEGADDCLQVAFLGDSFFDDAVIDAVNVANANSCGETLCFDPAEGSISTFDQAAIVAGLGTFQVLYVMNKENFVAPMNSTTKAAVEAALSSGTLKKLMVYDAFAGNGDMDVNIPGLNDGDVVRNPLRAQEPILVGVPPITGPGGVIGPHFGDDASHGYINHTADIFLDPATEQHFRQTDTGETTTVQYCYEDRVVYYSTIPMDFYLNEREEPFVGILLNSFCHFVSSDCSSPSSTPSIAPSEVPVPSSSSSPAAAPTEEPAQQSSPSPTVTPTAQRPVEECKSWFSSCTSREECCSGYCRLGFCRIFGFSSPPFSD